MLQLQFYYLLGDTVPLHPLAGEKAMSIDASIKLGAPPSPDIVADWLHVHASWNL